MKNALKSIVLIISILFSSISYAITITPKNDKEINTKNSTVLWKGNKVTGSHEGVIKIKSGLLKFNKEELIGGEFEIDMNSLVCTDLSGEYKGKLEGHLKSDDFFGVTKFPTATLKIKKVIKQKGNIYECTADITIKGKTEVVQFNTTLNKNSATAKIKIDRTKFDVKYGSGSFFDGLGDNMIYDEFDLNINLSF
ncbi:MAG: lipid-binding protein [Cryomorphaceae bacterium BACL11 MAG-121015-bin20]|nr:MAG: lipid-binding protein [Cryomorphaceae bacterium BACL11 MAG-121015-bin20]